MSAVTVELQGKVYQREMPTLRDRWQRIVGGHTFTAYMFLLIPLFVLFFIKIYPVFFNVYLSFTKYDLFNPVTFVGLKNYQDVFGQDVNLKAIRNTLYFAIGAVPIGTSLALVVAGLLRRRP